MSINMNQNFNNYNSNNNINDWRKINPQIMLAGLEKIGKIFV